TRTLLLASCSFLLSAPPTPRISTLSLHDALPICTRARICRLDAGSRNCSSGSSPTATPPAAPSGITRCRRSRNSASDCGAPRWRSEEHTSELQSRVDLVCRLLLEKKNQQQQRRRQ